MDSAGKVCIKVLPALAESLGIEGTVEERISGMEGEDVCSVLDLLNRLCRRYHHFDQVVFDMATQKLTGHVAIFLNDRSLDLMDGLETTLADGDVLTLVPAIEGG